MNKSVLFLIAALIALFPASNVHAMQKVKTIRLADDIARMEKTERDTRLITHYEEQYQYFIAIALALLLLETVLTDRKSVKTFWKGRFN